MTASSRLPTTGLLLALSALVACGSGAPDGAARGELDPGTDVVATELFDSVTAQARARAAGPWRDPGYALTKAAEALSYGQYRGIRFRDEATLWRRGSPFRVQLFHPGGGFRVPVRVTLVEDGELRRLTFDPGRFSYGDEVRGMDLALPPEAHHAGFRVLHPLNDPQRWDEVVSFLGASYFRLLGPDHVYGLSARGVAVEVAGSRGEEFPDFTHFWLVRPDDGGEVVPIVALLEGPSLTGAYRFDLIPGSGTGTSADEAERAGASTPTVMEVEARLFARRDVPRLGVAPLTSMYLHGTFRRGGDDDVRPRVHDSQGLLMRTGDGEWIWRPLTNRAGVSITSLRDVDPRGFGLVQRERDFEAYLDLEAQYHRRPSLWVEVGEGDWGAGGVELVEFPSPSEFNDNIVAYWMPDGGMRAGESRTFRYRLVTFDDHLPAETLAPVVRTRVGWDALPGQVDPPPRNRRRVVVDFGEVPGAGVPEAEVDLSRGRAEDLRVQRLPDGGVRATFALVPEGDAPADMRLQLVRGERVVSETWSWLWRSGDGA